jgi:hypothetical protein
MSTLTLYQRNDPTGTQYEWQKLAGIYAGSDFETGQMSECVSLVYIDGKDIRGYHAGGSLRWANWQEIKDAKRDVPHTRMIAVMGRTRDLRGFMGVASEAIEVVKDWEFRNIQWEFYKSSNAVITPTGVVSDKESKGPVKRLFTFISKFAPPGLDR